ncbi:MAG: UvrD-helicase domain-containing protein [Bacteroidota bacterium]|nr:UvrD-helicase domain-containing protein [Bacteroidota bacterium]
MTSLQIYKSSAGSGKTFILVLEYLKIALRFSDSFKHILAITFTNKAADEMKTRIIMALYELSELKQDNKYRSFFPEYNDAELKSRATSVLNRILHNYSYFNIGTIDSFFQNIIKTFTRELKLPVNYSIELDFDKVLTEIVDNLLDELEENKSLIKWLTEFVNERLGEGKTWNITREIIHFGSELNKESFHAIEQKINSIDESDVAAFKNEMLSLINSFEKSMDDFGKKALKAISDYGLCVNDFKNGSRGVANHFNKILLNKKDYVPTATVLKVYNGDDDWYSKTSTLKEKIQTIVTNHLHDYLTNVVEYYDKNILKYNSANDSFKYIYDLGIIRTLSRKLAEYRTENEILFISDINKLLNILTSSTDSPFLYEKIGNKFSSFMIDEFQDTSDFQWNNIKPLVINSLSQEYKVVIVGDVKQSIYRWRNGNMRLLQSGIKSDLIKFNESIEEKQLSKNFRSLENIVLFNNTIINNAFNLLLNTYHELAKDSLFCNSYKELVQEPSKKELLQKGFVRVNFFSDKEEDEDGLITGWKEKSLLSLPLIIEEIRAKNYDYKDITILVRTNNEGSLVADYLTSHTNKYRVVSGDSLIIGNSFYVKFIIKLLRFICQEKNDLLKTEILMDYINIKDIPFDENIFSDFRTSEIFKNYIPDKYINSDNNLANLSLYEMIDELIELFELESIKTDAYIIALKESVLDYTVKYSTNIPEFLRWWDDEGSLKSIQMPEMSDAIKIYTIHKSKGLEFDVVIMPFADWNLSHTGYTSPMLWVNSNEQPFNLLPYVPVRYRKEFKNSLFSASFIEEYVLSMLDSLNVLYVAFTRASERLYINSCIGRNMENNLTSLSKLIYSSLNSASNISNNKFIIDFSKTLKVKDNVYEFGDNSEKKQSLSSDLTKQSELIKNEDIKINKWLKKISEKRKNNEELYIDTEQANNKLKKGIVIHRILSEMVKFNDLQKVINNLKYNGQIGSNELNLIIADILEIMQIEQVREWFSGRYTVHNEREIIRNGRVYRPDRVLIDNDKAIIIDYKTGKHNPNDIPQVNEYSDLMEELGYIVTGKYLLYFNEKQIQRIN